MACIGMLAGALASCDTDKTIEYQEAPLGAPQPVYFTLQPTQVYVVGEEDWQVFFNAFRADTRSGDDSVIPQASFDLTWSGDTDMFLTLPSSLTFMEGDLEAQGVIEFDSTTFDPSKVYQLKATLNGTETTPYSQNYLEFTFQYSPMSAWEPFMADPALDRDGFGVYTLNGYYAGQVLAYVESRYSLLNENQIQYRFSLFLNGETAPATHMVIAESNDGGKNIYVPEQEYDYNQNYGVVYVMEGSYYSPNTTAGGSYFDEISGTFYLDVIFFVDQGYFGFGYETCTLFGFADTNSYSITLTDAGTVMIGETNYQLVNFDWSDTVQAMAYTVVDTESVTGEDGIDDDLVWKVAEGMLDGTTQFTQLQTPGMQALSFPSGGKYTIVAGGFRAESDGSTALKTTATLSFTYVTPNENEGWTSLGYVEYTDGYICSAYGADALTYYVEVQESDEYEGYMRLVNPYGADYPYNEPGDWNPNVNSYLFFDLYNSNCVYVDYSPQTLDWGDGVLSCYSYAAFMLSGGGDYSDVIAQGANGVNRNGVITFPFNTLLFGLGEDGWYYANYLVDVDASNAAGKLVYIYGDDGEPIAPFKIDLTTMTDDPLAAATRSIFTKDLKLASMNFSNATPVQLKKQAKHVKYKSRTLENNLGTTHRQLKPKF